MKNTTCIFCNQTREKAKEHIWPRWLQILVYGSTKENFAGIHVSDYSPEIKSIRNQSGENLVYGAVCKICNNGWMNDIESNFSLCLEKIRTDDRYIFRLSKKERFDIAVWGLKTSMMINAGTNYRKIIPDQHYKFLFKNRNIPKNIKVDICRININERLKWVQSNIKMEITRSKNTDMNDPRDIYNNSYVISMQIENFGIKVIHYADCKEKGYEILPSRQTHSLRIWPFIKNNQFNLRNSYNNIEEFQDDTLIKK